MGFSTRILGGFNVSGYVREFQESDATYVAAHLRDADRAEIAAHSGRLPVDAIMGSARHSDLALTVCDATSTPAAVFGVAPGGCIWLLGTDALVQPPLAKQFLRECRRHVALLQERYPLLHNVIDARNVVHIRWLRWMGFVFIRRIPDFGVEQRLFFEFVRIKHV